MRHVALLVLGMAGGPALAASPEVWAGLYDGRLAASVDRDPAAAGTIYETLLQDLSQDDTLHGRLLYWLGRARYQSGDLPGARSALEAASRDADMHDRARTYLGLMEVETRQVSQLPYQEGFDQGLGSWVRGWPKGDVEDLGIIDEAGPGDRALRWKVQVREGEDDLILLPMGGLPRGPTMVRFFAHARGFTAHLRIALETEEGDVWLAEPVEVGTEEWTAVELGPGDFSPAHAPERRARRLPGDLRALVVKDVTAFHGDRRGDNVILVDDFEIR